MVNYVPDTTEECEILIHQNNLFQEVLERRCNAENPCDECELLNTDSCNDCYHKSFGVKLYPVMESIKNNKDLKKFYIDRKINLTCPVCSKDWTGIATVYINDKNDNLMAANIDSKYCPMCGKKF